MSKLIKILLVTGISVTGLLNGYDQNIPRLCICFEEDTEFINVGIREDSTFTSFSIIREGFETEEQREKAWEEYLQGPPTEERYPYFTYNYVATWKPEKVTSIKEVNDCVEVVIVDEYRLEGFRRPPKTRSDLYIFIKKLPDGTFLKWDAMAMDIE